MNTQRFYTIRLTRDECRLLTEAAGRQDEFFAPSPGPVELERGKWHTFANWTTWITTREKNPPPLAKRKQFYALSARIESALQAEPSRTAEEVPAGLLF